MRPRRTSCTAVGARWVPRAREGSCVLGICDKRAPSAPDSTPLKSSLAGHGSSTSGSRKIGLLGTLHCPIWGMKGKRVFAFLCGSLAQKYHYCLFCHPELKVTHLPASPSPPLPTTPALAQGPCSYSEEPCAPEAPRFCPPGSSGCPVQLAPSGAKLNKYLL